MQAMRLLVIDEIHLLGDERGPMLEVIVSRTSLIASHTERPVRVIGLSTGLANAKDLTDWLGIKQVSATRPYQSDCVTWSWGYCLLALHVFNCMLDYFFNGGIHLTSISKSLSHYGNKIAQ